MRNGFLTAAMIVLTHAAVAVSQDPSASKKAEAPTPPPPAQEEVPAVQPNAPPGENVGGAWLTGDPSQGAGGPGYGGQGYGGPGNGPRVWGGAEFLLWGIKPGNNPPLLSNGVLGAPGTTTLYGGSQDLNPRYGGRFTLGAWLDEDQTRGIEGSYLFLSAPTDNFNASSSGAAGSIPLSRPFINAINGLQDRQIISFPGVSGGSFSSASSSNLQGGELNMLCNLCCCSTCATCCDSGSGYRLDMIGGFRYLQLNESLGITENIVFLPTAPAPFVPGDSITVVDRFETRNSFYGGQLGARAEWWRGRWFINTTGKVALGDMHQEVRVSGSTTFNSAAGGSVTQPGGLYAQPSNIGSYSRDVFAVIPELGLNVGRQVTNNVRIFAGYSVLYVSSVVRPGNQIDTTVNPTQLPTAAGPGTLVGPARPTNEFHTTDFWAQGLNLGVQFRW